MNSLDDNFMPWKAEETQKIEQSKEKEEETENLKTTEIAKEVFEQLPNASSVDLARSTQREYDIFSGTAYDVEVPEEQDSKKEPQTLNLNESLTEEKKETLTPGEEKNESSSTESEYDVYSGTSLPTEVTSEGGGIDFSRITNFFTSLFGQTEKTTPEKEKTFPGDKSADGSPSDPEFFQEIIDVASKSKELFQTSDKQPEGTDTQKKEMFEAPDLDPTGSAQQLFSDKESVQEFFKEGSEKAKKILYDHSALLTGFGVVYLTKKMPPVSKELSTKVLQAVYPKLRKYGAVPKEPVATTQRTITLMKRPEVQEGLKKSQLTRAQTEIVKKLEVHCKPNEPVSTQEQFSQFVDEIRTHTEVPSKLRKEARDLKYRGYRPNRKEIKERLTELVKMTHPEAKEIQVRPTMTGSRSISDVTVSFMEDVVEMRPITCDAFVQEKLKGMNLNFTLFENTVKSLMVDLVVGTVKTITNQDITKNETEGKLNQEFREKVRTELTGLRDDMISIKQIDTILEPINEKIKDLDPKDREAFQAAVNTLKEKMLKDREDFQKIIDTLMTKFENEPTVSNLESVLKEIGRQTILCTSTAGLTYKLTTLYPIISNATGLKNKSTQLAILTALSVPQTVLSAATSDKYTAKTLQRKMGKEMSLEEVSGEQVTQAATQTIIEGLGTLIANVDVGVGEISKEVASRTLKDSLEKTILPSSLTKEQLDQIIKSAHEKVSQDYLEPMNLAMQQTLNQWFAEVDEVYQGVIEAKAEQVKEKKRS